MDKLTTHTLADGREILFVEVPQCTSIFDIEIVTNQSVIPYGKSIKVPDGEYKSFPNYQYIDLPQGNYSIIGVSDQMSEEKNLALFSNVSSVFIG